MDQLRDSFEDAAPRQPQQAQSDAWGTAHPAFFAGHEIKPQMLIYSDEGTYLGVIEGIEGDEMRMRADADGVHRLLPLSLVAGVDGDRVIMRGRGDNAFGMEA